MCSKNATSIVAMQVYYIYISDKHYTYAYIQNWITAYYLHVLLILLSSCIQGVLKLLYIIATSLLPTASPLNQAATSQVYKRHPVA